MRQLTYIENKKISAAYASISTSMDGSVLIKTTGKSANNIMGMNMNGINIELAFYPDHINDKNNNVVFSGTDGEFCYHGNSYTVFPIDGGSGVVITKGC